MLQGAEHYLIINVHLTAIWCLEQEGIINGDTSRGTVSMHSFKKII
jgi:hypothetical protein